MSMHGLGHIMESSIGLQAPYDKTGKSEVYYPELSLDMGVLAGQDDLDIDDMVTLVFKAKVKSLRKDEYYSSVGYSLLEGEIKPKEEKERSKEGVKKLRDGMRKMKIVMPAGA